MYLPVNNVKQTNSTDLLMNVNPAKEENTRSRQEESALFFNFLTVPKGHFSIICLNSMWRQRTLSEWKHSCCNSTAWGGELHVQLRRQQTRQSTAQKMPKRGWYRTQSERWRRKGQSLRFLERWHRDLFSVLSSNDMASICSMARHGRGSRNRWVVSGFWVTVRLLSSYSELPGNM